tara:strand:+ start:31576 stop:32718 length:1143 start_codon:yes stop_codon:yes gene_type:complete
MFSQFKINNTLYYSKFDMIRKYLIIFFIIVSNYVYANNSNIYLIKDIEVIIEDKEELIARGIALNEAFEKSFNKLLKKLVSDENFRKIKYNDQFDLIPFIKDYKIKNEEFFDSKYTVLIDVNFYEEKISIYLDSFKLNKSNLVSEDFLVLPVYSELKNLYLWEKKNKWYSDLINEYDNQSLLNLYFPEQNFLNNFIASPKEIIQKKSDKLSKILSKFKKNSGIIIFLEEVYDPYLENFKSNIFLTQFTKDKLENIKIIDSRLKNIVSKTSQRELLAKYTIEELNAWWKNKTKLPNLLNEIYVINLTYQSNSIIESIKLENILSQSTFIKQIKKMEFNKKNIIYEITAIGDVEKINLSLRPKNIFLKKMINSDTYKIETLF